MKLYAMSVKQPWAHVILRKGKNVENRQRNCHYRGFIAIHSSQSPMSSDSFDYLEDEFGIKLDPKKLDYGCVVGFAKIVDVILKKQVTSKTKKWFGGKYGYVLKNVIILKKPINTNGGRGLWHLKGAALKNSLKQLPAASRKRIEKDLFR